MLEIHAAAKETVTLAEQRFMSNSHEWQFDNAWQEVLNHATEKVMDADKQKAECHDEHERCTRLFHCAEQKLQQLEDRYRRSITKARPYFEEKQICQDQLQAQKNRIEELQAQVLISKRSYTTALRNLETISDDIHRQRGDYPQLLRNSSSDKNLDATTTPPPPPGPREPGVGAASDSSPTTSSCFLENPPLTSSRMGIMEPLPDFRLELEKCDYQSLGNSQVSLSEQSQISSIDNNNTSSNITSSTSSLCNSTRRHYSNKNIIRTPKKTTSMSASAPLAIMALADDDEEEDDVIIKSSAATVSTTSSFNQHFCQNVSAAGYDLDDLDECPDDYNDDNAEAEPVVNEDASITNCLHQIPDEYDLEALKQKVKFLAVRPIEGGDGQQEHNANWEHELKVTVDKLDHLMMLNECAKQQQQHQQHRVFPSPVAVVVLPQQQKDNYLNSIKLVRTSTNNDKKQTIPIEQNINSMIKGFNNNVAIDKDKCDGKESDKPVKNLTNIKNDKSTSDFLNNLPITPEHFVAPLKQLHKLEPLPTVNVSLNELPLLQLPDVLPGNTQWKKHRRRSSLH